MFHVVRVNNNAEFEEYFLRPFKAHTTSLLLGVLTVLCAVFAMFAPEFDGEV